MEFVFDRNRGEFKPYNGFVTVLRL
jgi:hypothetical protein